MSKREINIGPPDMEPAIMHEGRYEPLPANVQIHEGITVQVGDALVITPDRPLNAIEQRALIDQLSALLPLGASVIVLPHNVRATVMRAM